jgi:hypothetical protein
MTERVGISEATLIAGIPKRTLQAFAASGGIPGAGKPAGRWTFDVEELRRWARKVNRKAPCPISTNAGTWWARFKVLGVEYRRSLRTSVRSEAERRLGGLRKQIEGEARFGVAEPRTFAAAAESWKQHCTRDLSAKTVKRYLTSLKQVWPYLGTVHVHTIDTGKLRDLVKARRQGTPRRQPSGAT